MKLADINFISSKLSFMIIWGVRILVSTPEISPALKFTAKNSAIVKEDECSVFKFSNLVTSVLEC